jgi:EmrB/QacA subfamily drug resistance transporter
MSSSPGAPVQASRQSGSSRSTRGLDWRTGTMLAAILGSAIVFLDSTVVNVALAKIGADLPSHFFATLEAQSYIYNGYLLSLSALLILAGALADAYGRRKLFTIGLIGFGVSSVLCGLAVNMEMLIVLRIIQGAAGALLVPGALALITNTFSGAERGRAFGFWAAASAATAIAGPVVGGTLVDTFSWRAVFFLNVPLIIIALWATARYVRESSNPQASRHFDWAGAALAATAIGGLAFGAIYGQQHRWTDALGPGAIIVGTLAAIAFLVLMARSTHPLVPLGLFRSRNFAVTNLSTFLIYGALYVIGYQQSIFSQGTLGYSAAAAGFIGVPGALLLILFSARIGAWAGRIGPRRFMTVGPALMGAGILWLTRMPVTSAPWHLSPGDLSSWIPSGGYLADFLPASLLFGLGLALMVAPLTTALMAAIPENRAGLGSAINNAISRVGPQLAGALIFVAITGAFYADLSAKAPTLNTNSDAVRAQVSPLNAPDSALSPALILAADQSSTDSFHLGMGLAASLLFAGALVNGLGIRDQKKAVSPTQGAQSQSEQSDEVALA